MSEESPSGGHPQLRLNLRLWDHDVSKDDSITSKTSNLSMFLMAGGPTIFEPYNSKVEFELEASLVGADPCAILAFGKFQNSGNMVTPGMISGCRASSTTTVFA